LYNNDDTNNNNNNNNNSNNNNNINSRRQRSAAFSEPSLSGPSSTALSGPSSAADSEPNILESSLSDMQNSFDTAFNKLNHIAETSKTISLNDTTGIIYMDLPKSDGVVQPDKLKYSYRCNFLDNCIKTAFNKLSMVNDILTLMTTQMLLIVPSIDEEKTAEDPKFDLIAFFHEVYDDITDEEIMKGIERTAANMPDNMRYMLDNKSSLLKKVNFQIDESKLNFIDQFIRLYNKIHRNKAGDDKNISLGFESYTDEFIKKQGSFYDGTALKYNNSVGGVKTFDGLVIQTKSKSKSKGPVKTVTVLPLFTALTSTRFAKQVLYLNFTLVLQPKLVKDKSVSLFRHFLHPIDRKKIEFRTELLHQIFRLRFLDDDFYGETGILKDAIYWNHDEKFKTLINEKFSENPYLNLCFPTLIKSKALVEGTPSRTAEKKTSRYNIDVAKKLQEDETFLSQIYDCNEYKDFINDDTVLKLIDNDSSNEENDFLGDETKSEPSKKSEEKKKNLEQLKKNFIDVEKEEIKKELKTKVRFLKNIDAKKSDINLRDSRAINKLVFNNFYDEDKVVISRIAKSSDALTKQKEKLEIQLHEAVVESAKSSIQKEIDNLSTKADESTAKELVEVVKKDACTLILKDTLQRLTCENKKLKALKSVNLTVIPQKNIDQLQILYNNLNYEQFANYFYANLKQFTDLLKYFEKDDDEEEKEEEEVETNLSMRKKRRKPKNRIESSEEGNDSEDEECTEEEIVPTEDDIKDSEHEECTEDDIKDSEHEEEEKKKKKRKEKEKFKRY
jgi:hypothetical protein